ncbi:hypothetical protein [Lichenibacterium dinghuense]|uniref:hypothetical protein n=1 Tax=Lichenibacterium dinghuense TaxID=2895977 RepID=UPI001F316F18|nr:hypothetical protein [Lichenibacterium sp. 6Y81]
MKLLFAICAALCLASCYAVTEVDGPKTASRDTTGHLVSIAPANGPKLSVPAVSTSKGVLAYDRDLRSCQRESVVALGSDGSVDDVEILTRSIGSKLINKTVTVNHEFDDMATRRDHIVKKCLSKRGYVLTN